MIKPHLFAIFEAIDPLAEDSLAYGDLIRCDMTRQAYARRAAARLGGVVVPQRQLPMYQRIQCALFRNNVRVRKTGSDARLQRLLNRLDLLHETLVLRIACELPERVVQPWSELNPNYTSGKIRLFIATQYLNYLFANPPGPKCVRPLTRSANGSHL